MTAPEMTAERWREIKHIFDVALELDGDQRAALLARTAAEDAALAADVRRMLASYEEAADFIEEPVVSLVHQRPDVGDEPDGEKLPEARRRIGPYALEDVLGRGGMGTVYLARRADEDYHHRVAVKVLRRELDSRELIHRFRSERQILATLDHPAIARFFDGGTTEDGRPYLVMEHVEGEALDRYCRSRRLTVAERLELFLQVCGAVQFAHQSLIVHRDLKPGNILVTADGRVKLLDFGIAKLLEPESFPLEAVRTEPGVAPMTLEYASPEQIRLAPVTAASDVYSLGVVLYELLTEHSPYASRPERRDEIMRAICDEEPQRPANAITRPTASTAVERKGREGAAAPLTPAQIAAERRTDLRGLRRTLRGDLETVMRKALAKEPQRRYATARELARDVERYLTHRPVLAHPDRLSYRAGKFLRRHRWSVGTAAGVLMALFAFLATLLVQRVEILNQKSRAEEVTRILVDLFEVSDPDSAQGAEITAREVMDRGIQEIHGRLDDQPQLKAQLLETVGRVYGKLGLYGDALVLYEEALELRGAGGEGARDLVPNLVAQGDMQEASGEYAAAEALYRAALQTLGADDAPEREQVLAGLGVVAREQGDMTAAERYHRDALAMARRLYGNSDPHVAERLGGLGNVASAGGDFDTARTSYERALEIYREHYGDEHTEVATLLLRLGAVLAEAGHYEPAEQRVRQAVATLVKLYDDAHPLVFDARFNLATILYWRGHYAEAEDLCRQAIAARRRDEGKEHPDVAMAVNLLGLIRRDLGDLDQARDLLREALEIWRGTFGENHPEVAVGLANLAGVLRAQGQADEAEELFREALAATRATFGEEHPSTASLLNNLALLLSRRDDLEEARELYEKALDLRRRILGPDHPDVARTLHNLARIRRRAGDYAAAEANERQAIAIYEDKLGATHRDVGVALQGLASILLAAERFAEAESAARRALVNFDESLPPHHLFTLATRSVLGGSLAGLGHYEEAEALLLEAYDGMVEQQGPQGSMTLGTRQRLHALYQAWDRPRQADEYQTPADG